MTDEIKVGALEIQQTALHVAFHVALDHQDSEEVRKVLNDYALMMREIVAHLEFPIANAKEWERVSRGLRNPSLALQITANAKEHIEAKRRQTESNLESKSETGGAGKSPRGN
jgi:DNA polymerase elongation subunit (family B)